MRFLGNLLARIPYRWLMAFGAALGALVWGLRIRRRVVLENLRLAFPEKTEAERVAIARATYRNLGRIVPEFLRVPSLPREELERMFVYEGWENYEKARATGLGVVACTAHFGNFDLLASAHTLRGVPITQISRRMGKSGANDAWRSTRKRSGIEELEVGKTQNVFAACTRALKTGRTIGWTIDQNQPGRTAIFPTFFGVPCATSPTPALLSRRTGAAAVFCLSVPLGDGRHKVVIEGPLFPPDTGDRERDALLFVQDLNDRLERYVREYPDRWYWLHRRWKRKHDAPPAAAGALTPPDATG
jgi:Kdo2-lipid IVA lauroyltransferase/acyltransferase